MCAARFTFFKEFEAAEPPGICYAKFPAVEGEKPFGRKAPEVPEILLRRSFPPQRAKFLYGAFFLPSFFFAPTCSKKKRTNAFVQFLFDTPFVYNLMPSAPVIMGAGGF